MHHYGELRARAVEFVAEWSGWGPVAVLAPVREAADEAALAACGDALPGVHRFAFRELVLELSAAELNRRGLVPVGRVVREALAARVTEAAVRAGALGYLAGVAGYPGFPKAVAATLEELRLNSVTPEALRACGDSGGDLAHLLAAYTAELEARGFADHAARVALALAATPTALADRAIVALDVQPRTAMERELLAVVLKSARAHLELGFASNGHGGQPTDDAATSLCLLQRHLFGADPVAAGPLDPSVAIFSTSGEALECVEIARRILALAASGVRFDQCAILVRSPERYLPLVAEALRRAGIPSWCARAARRPDPAGRAFLALLHCAEERLSASRFAEYLSLGQAPAGDEPRTPAAWERFLVDAAVIGGADRWRTRLDALGNDLHRRHRAEPDATARDRLNSQIAAVESLRAFAIPIVESLVALPHHATWGDWIDALAGLAAATLRDPDRVLALLEELEPMAPIGPVPLSQIILTIGPRLTMLAEPPKGSRFGRVFVGGIEEARGMAFAHVFVPGVNEGLFPRPPAGDPLLLEAQRAALGVELRADDSELLRVAAACATESFSASFSRLDLLTGRERVPSFYAFAIHRAAGGPDLDVRAFEAAARAATESRIGWPAPPDPAAAIDDAEFDLATLAPLTPGSGQYLKRLPGRAVDSLRLRWMRWHKPWKGADGLVVEEIGSRALAGHRLTAHAWSPSVLQHYARCPYRFALRGIFGLRPALRPASIQRMDPATRGSLFHAVQFEAMRILAAERLLPVTPANLGTALERLDAALEGEAAKAEAELAPAIPRIWHDEVQALRTDLRGWLQQKAQQDAEWSPMHCELAFGEAGGAPRDPASHPDPVLLPGGFRLQGAIDMVERHPSGVLRVVDHKTGRIPDPRPELLGRGEVLQPALYALAAEALLGTQVSSARLAYATISQNFTTIDITLHDWTRRRAQSALELVDSAIAEGFLPAAPRERGCEHCDYLPVCGPYEEERVRQKSQAELRPLKELRGWR
jgi:ATP-dependent helicase/nuclease subunit B